MRSREQTPAPSESGIAVVDWGRTEYSMAWERQRAMADRRRSGEIPDTLVLTEHEPVYTVGTRPGADSHLREPAGPGRAPIPLVRTNRGGDITYHGPGQLVGYPILDLSSQPDLHHYLRQLERVLIHVIGCLGLAAARRDGMTGIWLEKRKIAAIGVAVRRWVTTHGFALNVSNDLAPFDGIVPCGITDGSVTSIERELNKPVSMESAKALVAEEFARVFASKGAGPCTVAQVH